MGHAGRDGAVLGKAMLTPEAKHTGKCLAAGVKWARRWGAGSNAQPVQLIPGYHTSNLACLVPRKAGALGKC